MVVPIYKLLLAQNIVVHIYNRVNLRPKFVLNRYLIALLQYYSVGIGDIANFSDHGELQTIRGRFGYSVRSTTTGNDNQYKFKIHKICVILTSN